MTSPHQRAWPATTRTTPLQHEVALPGSKSLTNRELVLAALADGPSTLRAPLIARDTTLMVAALRELGAHIEEVDSNVASPDLLVTPIPEGHRVDATIDCGLAGTVMRFVPPLMALIHGHARFDGDDAARARPMSATLDALGQLGLGVKSSEGKLPFTLTNTGVLSESTLRIDASASSQFVSGLLLVAARLPEGLRIEHTGSQLPSIPHIDMTLECLRARGVKADMVEPGVWVVEPGPIAAHSVTIEPDLSNAAPFLAAPLITGGRLSVSGWPESTTQVGALVPGLLEHFGATVSSRGGIMTIDGGAGLAGGATLPGVDLDLGHAGELAPTLVTLAALGSQPSTFRGIGHLRGHETDRLAALVANITGLGGVAVETEDGITVSPASLRAGEWRSYDDHRMATSGALLGLAVEGITVDDIGCTSKTLPEFPILWEALLKSPSV